MVPWLETNSESEIANPTNDQYPYSKTRDAVSRNHRTQVDASIWERRPGTSLNGTLLLWFCRKPMRMNGANRTQPIANAAAPSPQHFEGLISISCSFHFSEPHSTGTEYRLSRFQTSWEAQLDLRL